MICLGIDFGWQSQPSGLAAFDCKRRRLHQLDLRRLDTLEEIGSWVDLYTRDKPAIAGVDAPLVIPNATGMRLVDKLMHRNYGRYHAGCYPANLSRPFANRVTALARLLEHRGFEHAPAIQPRQAGRYQIEVHPHAACVQLFGLDRILKYKKGPVAERRRTLEVYRGLLLALKDRTPSLHSDLPPIPAPGHALKPVEDQLDAVLAAYIAAHWWYWGGTRNHSYGTAAEGYIVVPHRHGPMR